MFRTILLPVDLAEESSWQKALPAALLHAHSDGGKLHVLTVVPDFGDGAVGGFFPADFMERAMSQTRTELDAFCTRHIPADVPFVATVRTGRIYHEIVALADETKADLIVMASHRPAVRDYLIGPNAERVMRHAACSVMVVRS